MPLDSCSQDLTGHLLKLLSWVKNGEDCPKLPSSGFTLSGILNPIIIQSSCIPSLVLSQEQILLYPAAAVTSVVSDSVRPHRRRPTRLPCPWDSPGKNTGVGCHFLLQCMKVKSESEVTQSCLTLSNPMDCSLPGSSAHGIFQARVLEWGAIAFSVFYTQGSLNFPYSAFTIIK